MEFNRHQHALDFRSMLPVSRIWIGNRGTFVIRHYIVSAFRHISKSKGVFAANIFGFTLNFIVVIFGLNYILFETSYDNFHENGNRIYRVLVTKPDYDYTFPTTSALLAPTLVEAYPEVESAVRFYYRFAMPFSTSPNETTESGAFNVAYADPDVFSVFSFGTIAPATFAEFSRPNTAVLSRTMARRFFGDEDPTGRLLHSQGLGSGPLEVIGVMDDVPRNSHLRPDVFVSFATVPGNMVGRGSDLGWMMQQFPTYIMLIDGKEDTLGGFLDKLAAFPSIYMPDTYSDTFTLEPLSEVYFSPHWAPVKGDINYVYFALVYLVLISFMTVANYVNINIAHLVRRVKEMGLRKSFGAGRTQVISQMVVETLMNCLAAVGISILCVLILKASRITILEHLSQSEISVQYIGSVGISFLLIGLISGIGPAFVFYRVNPVDMLANRVSTNWTANSLRKGLLFFQLAISVALLLLTSLLYNQVTYMTAKPLGYEKENKIVIPAPVSAGWHQRLAEGFRRSPHVVNVASTRGYPGFFAVLRVPWKIRGTETQLEIGMLTLGRNFLETLKIGLIHGRDFVDDELRNAVLLNETAFNALGLDEEDVGTELEIVGKVRVVGIVADFHIWSLHHAIEPLMLSFSDSDTDLTHLIVDIEPTNQDETLDHLSRTFRELMPNNRFDYFFLDAKLEELYSSDRQILDTLLLLALVAFALAVAGIYNYGVFFTLNRIREVAIRKIHGASAGDIVRMNVTAISKSVGLSLVISIPVVYWVYDLWIAQYAYRAEVSLLQVALPVLAIYVLTCVMVTRETLKTAGMKPAQVIQSVQQ